MIVLSAVTLLCKATQLAVDGHKFYRGFRAAATEWRELQSRANEIEDLLAQLSAVYSDLKGDPQLVWLQKAKIRTKRLLTDINRFLDNTGHVDGHSLGPLRKLKWVLSREQFKTFLVRLDQQESNIILCLLFVITLCSCSFRSAR